MERRGPKNDTSSPAFTCFAHAAPGVSPCTYARNVVAPRVCHESGVYVRMPTSGRNTCTLSPGRHATSRSDAPDSSRRRNLPNGCTAATLATRKRNRPAMAPSMAFAEVMTAFSHAPVLGRVKAV